MKKDLSSKQNLETAHKCGLCGKNKKLVRTRCCGEWVCDDNDKYVLFSYARNSCWRNHDRYTLCSYHFNNNHKGRWQTCAKCKKSFDTEDYVWYGTNDYNFVKLPDPPSFEPTLCATCHHVINRGEEGYTRMPDGKFYCEACSPMPRFGGHAIS